MGEDGSSPAIKPINKAVIHRICSGQVILDLSSAVKELVENSLDAGSTVIEISLKEYGEEQFKVIDNGCGISPNNFQSLALKHHTSKISDFTDLHCLVTFGFRGEALSSLCALGFLSVETRTKNESIGTHLTFDHSGAVIKEKKTARQVGTTVTVEKLFSPLPVRCKEFSRNIKREYGKLITLLNAYALIAKGVRLLCTNTTSKGSKSVVLKTQGSSSLKDNIINVFGLNTFQCLTPLHLTLSGGCSIEGFLSKPGNGNGRNSGDRQFFYVNNRPVDMPKVSKMINELYRGSNSKQYPIAILNFSLPTDSYDVNVTPDKRKVFFSMEGSLMVSLREELEKVYSPDQCVYSVSQVENPSSEGIDVMDVDVDDVEEEPVAPLKVSSGKNDTLPKEFNQLTPERSRSEWLSTYRFVDLKKDSGSTEEVDRDGSSSRRSGIVQSSLINFVTVNKRKLEDETACNPLSEIPMLRRNTCLEFCENEVKEDDSVSESGRKRVQTGILEREGSSLQRSSCVKSDSEVVVEDDLIPRSGTKRFHSSTKGKPEEFELVPKSSTKFQSSVGKEVDNSVVGNRRMHSSFGTEKSEGPILARCNNNRDPDMEGMQETRCGSSAKDTQLDRGSNPTSRFMHDDLFEGDTKAPRPSSIMVTYPPTCFSMNEMKRRREHRLSVILANKSSSLLKRRAPRNYTVATMEESQPEDEEGKERSLAEAIVELERFFNKEDFAHMQVIGQFNLGFIIGKIKKDLFIIDQHAADEKYNFERLSQSTTFNLQPLFQPIRMELSPEDEVVASMHMDLIRKNGFVVAQDANAQPGHQFLLKAVPFSKNITFGAEDLKELISSLVDGKGDCTIISSYKLDTSDSLCPSRVRAMLASRACRTSCMVGDALTKTEMQRILTNLATLRSPWNCPHGRPTMRHLVDLTTIRKEEMEGS
ncbi:hypothetical protein LUZ63_011897 [Rhynchospora breviuscula]|uniref:DNA mismatch repair protein PMS1 n=1 Tax=Rhynchospora breviuscula TaxID=2022672 RepID=A0A9Q0CJN5_9POAL|nr:hypothetical protein LUZ63_011897 [Rhynchospora breviuscula]